MSHANTPGKRTPPLPGGPGHDATGVAAVELVAGRYLLGAELGRGGYGVVYEAVDTVTGEHVALKRFMGDINADELGRVRREVAALRLIRCPGVVRLRDDGEHDGAPFLVMELVQGCPFPGRPIPMPWPELAPLAKRLLEILAEVHHAGVIHRDLKPSNILVDAHGTPTLLDFGLARGDRLGPTLTVSGAALGTPQYLAPEQAFGQPADPRSDLWAVGALLHEALIGYVPHAEPGCEITGLFVRRATEPTNPIRARCPELPPAVAAAIDALLAQRGDDRPRSAEDALALLGGQDDAPRLAHRELRPAALATAATALMDARRAVDLVGPHGAGHTHLLDALAARAAATGTRVLRTVPALGPLGSLATALDIPGLAPGTPLDALLDVARDQLAAALHAGAVLIADDWAATDPWSRRVITALGPDRPVARSLGHLVDPQRVAVPLAPLRPDELAALFAGPDRILHLREDAAAELHRRSQGLPGPALAELTRWRRAGLARQESGIFSVSRADLERLASESHAATLAHAGARPGAARTTGSMVVAAAVRRAPHLRDAARLTLLAGESATPSVLASAWDGPSWQLEAALRELADVAALVERPDGRLLLTGVSADQLDWEPSARVAVHARLADALPPQDPRRLLHLVAAGRTDAIPRVALEVAAGLERAGHQERALAVLIDALAIARAGQLAAGAARLARKLALCALVEGSSVALQQASYEIRRSDEAGHGGVHTSQLRGLIDAALLLAEGRADACAARLDTLTLYQDPELETWSFSLRVRAARSGPLEHERRVVVEACAWADAVGGDYARSHRHNWAARLAYREAAWDTAAALQQAAAEEPTLPLVMQVSARLNAASALLEAARYDEALAQAHAAGEAAAACRHAAFELRAAWLERSVRFRRGDTLERDPELADLAAAVGLPFMAVLVHLNEAAASWRAAAREATLEHARRGRDGAAALRMVETEVMLRLLAAAFEATLTAAEADGAFASLMSWSEPSLALQALALLVLASGRLEPPWEACAQALGAEIARSTWEQRRDLVSPAEAMAVIAAGRSGDWTAIPGFMRAPLARRGGAPGEQTPRALLGAD